jgi:hypothetical protein
MHAATIGNFIGGAVCMATTYAFIYGRPPKQIAAWAEERRLVLQQQVQQKQQAGAGCKQRLPANVDGVVAVDMAAGGQKQH